MKIANGIEMLELPITIMGVESIIYPTLIWDDETVVLVDAGLSTSLPEIKKALEDIGISFDRLDKIIVTHQDIDHIGGIKNIQEEIPHVEVFAHEEDKPYIQGDKTLIRLNSSFKDRIKDLPEDEQSEILEIFGSVSVEVNCTLKDGEEIADCGGIIVIHTPGHTPGHICLYHKNTKTLVVGDAMNIVEGNLTGPNKQILKDDEVSLALNSIKKFEDFDVEYIISYHGGLFKDNPNERIKNFKGVND